MVSPPLELPDNRLGLGLAALGRPGYITLHHGDDIGPADRPEDLQFHAHEVMSAAWGAGIRYFDAARSYGKAEEFLRHWLAVNDVAPDAIRVGSKWGYTYTAGWRVDATIHEVKDHTIDVLNRQIGETRSHLGRYLDLYQIHSATEASGVLDNASVVDRLADLRDGGLAIGLTTSGPHQAATIRRAIGIERGGEPLFAAVQSTWNVLEPSAGNALGEAAEAGLAVIVKEAVANGRLTSRNRALARQLEAVIPGFSADAIAIAAALAQPWTSLVLSGAATADQLRSNVRAAAVPPGAIADLPPLAEGPAVYWETRAELPWN
jgi:aryl-alcohol dehydrogenase-like predicted oxidoreductase